MSEWTLQRVEQLAPDAAAVTAARGVAKPAKWRNLGHDGHLVWGECQGSGASPYQVRADLNDGAFKCSCPSRKLPCKHTLALLMMFADGKTVPTGARLPFVDEWAANRTRRAETKQKKEEAGAAAAPPPDPEAKARRVEKRESRVIAGVDQLETWLVDVVGQGLAAARAQPPAFWEQMAARLVDAQAPGLARRVREIGDRAVSEPHWQPRMLRGLAQLQLAVDAWRNVGALPPALQAAVRNLIGFSQSQEELRERPGERDRWQVIGRRQRQDDKLRTQYTWLNGIDHGTQALVLEFAVGAQPLPATYSLGQVLDLELVRFDDTPPLRALEKRRHATGARRLELPAGVDVATLQAQYATGLAANPWVAARPCVLGPVRPVLLGDRLLLEDAALRRIPVTEQFPLAWHLLALAGAGTLAVFGEWDGAGFEPLTVEHAGHWYTPAQLGALPLWSRVA